MAAAHTMIKTTPKREPGTGRWEKGSSGNPAGRPRGSKNRATIFQASIAGISENDPDARVQMTKEEALQGDRWARKFLLDRRFPRLKDRLIQLRLPDIRSERDAVVAYKRIYQAVTRGQITLAETKAFDELVSRRLRYLRQRGQPNVARERSHQDETMEDPEWQFDPFEGNEDLGLFETSSDRVPNDRPQAKLDAELPPERISELTGPAAQAASLPTQGERWESAEENARKEAESSQSETRAPGLQSNPKSRAGLLPTQPEPRAATIKREQTGSGAGEPLAILASRESSKALERSGSEERNQAMQPGKLIATDSRRQNESIRCSNGTPATPVLAPGPRVGRPEPVPAAAANLLSLAPTPPVDKHAEEELARLRRRVGRLNGVKVGGHDFVFLV